MQGDENSSPSELRQPSCMVSAIGATPVQAGRVSGGGTAGSRAARWVSVDIFLLPPELVTAVQLQQDTGHGPSAWHGNDT